MTSDQDREALAAEYEAADMMTDAAVTRQEPVQRLAYRDQLALRAISKMRERAEAAERASLNWKEAGNKTAWELQAEIEALRSFKERAREVMEPFAKSALLILADEPDSSPAGNISEITVGTLRSLARVYKDLSADDSPMAADSERKGRQLEWMAGNLFYGPREVGRVRQLEKVPSKAWQAVLVRDVVGHFNHESDARQALESAARDWLGLPSPSNGEVAG